VYAATMNRVKVDDALESKVIVAEHAFGRAISRLRISAAAQELLTAAAAERVDLILEGTPIEEALADAAPNDPWNSERWCDENQALAEEIRLSFGTFKRFEHDLRACSRRRRQRR
jgi:hypothetical protein